MAMSRSTPAAGWRRRVHWPQNDVAGEDARVAAGCVHAHTWRGGHVAVRKNKLGAGTEYSLICLMRIYRALGVRQ